MCKKSISFLFFGLPRKPYGGVKVALEYASYLATKGYDVHVVYSASLNFKKDSFIRKFISVLRYTYGHIFGFSGKSIFKCNDMVTEHLTFSLNKRHMPCTDYYVATAIRTSFYLKEYNIPNENKLYLIQDFENWGLTDQQVFDTYRFGLKNIVISNWLREKVEQSGAKCTLIRNGFDFNYFKLSNSIDFRSPYIVSMLYHNDERKGCKYGIEALYIVKEKYPQLKALFFGFPKRPSHLPDWIEYNRLPDKETHNRIYNTSSIYLAPSLQEGWGLTVGEAMICGNAIVCTNTLGFQEMVTEGKEGLIVPTKDNKALADAIIKLIKHPELRISMAKNAVNTISKFSWDDSFKLFESIL